MLKLVVTYVVVALSLSTLFAPAAKAFHGDYHCREINSIVRLSTNEVNTIAVDTLGYVWMGTSNGLNRYNGVEMQNFFASTDGENVLRNNFITSLCVTRDNNIWVAHRKGIDIYSSADGLFHNFDKKTQLGLTLDRRVTALRLSSDGGVLIATADYGGYKYNPADDTLLSIGVGNSVEKGNVVDIWGDNFDNVYLLYQSGVILRYNLLSEKSKIFANGSDESIKRGRDLSDDIEPILPLGRVRIAIDNERYILWMVSRQGSILRYDLKTDRYEEYDSADFVSKIGDLRRVEVDKNGCVYIVGSQVVRFDWETKVVEPMHFVDMNQNWIIPDKFTDVTRDREGTLWIGTTDKGALQYNQLFDQPRRPLYLSDDVGRVTHMSQLDDSRFVVGTLRKGLMLMNGGNERVVGTRQFNHVGFSNLSTVSSGRIFVNTPYQQCVTILDKSLNRRLGSVDISSVSSLLAVNDSTLYIGTVSALHRYDVASDRLSKIPINIQSPISSIVELEDGRLMVATLGKGLYILEEGGDRLICHISSNDSELPYDNVTTLSVDRHWVWIGTEGHGFALL